MSTNPNNNGMQKLGYLNGCSQINHYVATNNALEDVTILGQPNVISNVAHKDCLVMKPALTSSLLHGLQKVHSKEREMAIETIEDGASIQT